MTRRRRCGCGTSPVQTLRMVLLQNYTRTITGGKEVIKGGKKRLRATVSRPAMPGSPHRMTPAPGGAPSATPSGWDTSCTSARPATTRPPAPAAGTP